MAAEINVLTPEAIAELREMYAFYKTFVKNVPVRTDPKLNDDPFQAPECYLARTPVTGIPALNQMGTTGTGTGTSEDDVPGSAECQIYQILDGAMVYADFTVLVYNVMPVAIPANIEIVVVRDKFGTWLVPPVPLNFGAC